LGGFDYKVKSELKPMYEWAGSAVQLAAEMEKFDRVVAPQTLSRYIQRFGLSLSAEDRKSRGGRSNGSGDSQDAAEFVAELLHYLETRPLPAAKLPVLKPGRPYATEIVGCDLHFPHLGVLDKLKPQGVTLNGDSLDMAYLSKFRKNPRLSQDMQADLDLCREQVFARIAGVVDENCDKKVIMGNHELARWEDYLWDKCPPLNGLRCLNFENLLGLSEMGFRYQPTGYWLTPALYIFHGERHTNMQGGGSAMSAKKEMLDTGTSGASGHTHKLGLFYRRDMREERVWAEGGCLCDEAMMRRDGLTYVKGHVDKVLDWHLGFLRIEYNPDGEAFQVQALPILEDKGKVFAIVDGEEVRA
jgi:hypothetical protein